MTELIKQMYLRVARDKLNTTIIIDSCLEAMWVDKNVTSHIFDGYGGIFYSRNLYEQEKEVLLFVAKHRRL